MSKRQNANEFFSRRNPYYIRISRLLRSIAYDTDLFMRAVDLLCLFALTERQDENNKIIKLQEIFRKFMFIYKITNQDIVIVQKYLFTEV